MMLAVFTSFKPFTGAAADIQMRSLENWRAVFPDTEIVNFETATDESLPSDLQITRSIPKRRACLKRCP